jgi:hypothetical protein
MIANKCVSDRADNSAVDYNADLRQQPVAIKSQ